MVRAKDEAMIMEIKATPACEGERPTYSETWDMVKIPSARSSAIHGANSNSNYGQPGARIATPRLQQSVYFFIHLDNKLSTPHSIPKGLCREGTFSAHSYLFSPKPSMISLMVVMVRTHSTRCMILGCRPSLRSSARALRF